MNKFDMSKTAQVRTENRIAESSKVARRTISNYPTLARGVSNVFTRKYNSNYSVLRTGATLYNITRY